MTSSKRYILILPIISLAIGITVLLYGYWEHKNDIDEIKTLFDAHVDSVATLVEEGAREASISTALLYELAEEDALNKIFLLSDPRDDSTGRIGMHDEEYWRVQLFIKENGDVDGAWGPIPEETRQKFISYMGIAPKDELLDDEIIDRLGLFCVSHSLEQTLVVICRDDSWLSDLRKEVGIGPLLKGITKKDVLYVALQDVSGVLAAAPSLELISKWADDADLNEVLADRETKSISRVRHVNGRTVFEGLIPFEMADETVVLLRVGIDASALDKVEINSTRRYVLMLVLIVGIIILVIILAGLLWRWQSKKEYIENLLRLRESEREHWETVGKLAATVAHEVRSPLSTMKMIAQRLGREFKVVGENEQKEFAELLEMLGAESDRVNRVVTEFLDLGKPLILNFERKEIDTAIKEASWPMSIRAKKENKQLIVKSDCNREIKLDPERFRQLFSNVVENALDATEMGGSVIVQTECDKSTLKLFVSDEGPGLSELDLADVMKPFVSFKSAGTGLGLPLVKRLVEAHEGTFELRSSVSDGTTACITLPLGMDNQDD